MTNKKLVFLVFFFACSLNIYAQTADEIISKYIVFSGGEAKWKTINTLVFSGIYNYGGMEFPFTAYSKRPDKYKFIVPFNGKYYAQAYNGKTGWKIDAFKNQTQRTLLTGKPALAMANEADVELESAFIHYKEKGHRLTLEGEDSVNGKACFKIKFTRNNGDVETVFFDPLTFALVKKEAISKNEEMENGLLATYYSDYREIKGVRIPFTSISKSGEQTVLTLTLTKLDINVPVPDDEFE